MCVCVKGGGAWGGGAQRFHTIYFILFYVVSPKGDNFFYVRETFFLTRIDVQEIGIDIR